MNILEMADELMRQTGGDGRAAVILAFQYGASSGYHRFGPYVPPKKPAAPSIDDPDPAPELQAPGE